jgi:hypothetical protein
MARSKSSRATAKPPVQWGEILMATPAISGNLLIVRTGTQIVAVRG